MHHQPEVIPGSWQCLDVESALLALKAKHPLERGRHDHVVRQRRTHREQHRGCDQEWQKSLLFLGIEPRRDEGPQLVGDHRKTDEERREQRHLDLDKKRLVKLGVNQLALPWRESRSQRADQEAENVAGKIETGREGHHHCRDRAQQPRAQFDQMIEQRGLRLVDIGHVEGHLCGFRARFGSGLFGLSLFCGGLLFRGRF